MTTGEPLKKHGITEWPFVEFESAFEAAERLAAAERQLLLEQVARWLLQHIKNVPSEEQKTVKVLGIEINQADTQPISARDDEPPEAA